MTPENNELRNDNEISQIIDHAAEEDMDDVVLFRVKTGVRAGPVIIIDDGKGGGGKDGSC